MKKLILTLAFLLIAAPAMAGVDTASALVKLYKAYASTSGLCTSPVTFFNAEGDAATYPLGYSEVDFASAVNTIGTGTIADGTYNCVIFKISDHVTFVPAANEGTECVAGTSYTIDVCQDWGIGAPTITNPDTGATTTCTSNEDIVWIYLSTYSTNSGGSPDNQSFTPPTANGDSTNGVNLTSAMTVSADLTGTFVFGTAGRVATLPHGPGQTDICNMDQPTFGFSTQ